MAAGLSPLTVVAAASSDSALSTAVHAAALMTASMSRAVMAAAQVAGCIRSTSVRDRKVAVTSGGRRRASSRATCPVWPKTSSLMP